ncbi:hypothetical protein BKA80DRAFT_121172 [Phyllosticta citrichinensis]
MQYTTRAGNNTEDASIARARVHNHSSIDQHYIHLFSIAGASEHEHAHTNMDTAHGVWAYCKQKDHGVGRL